MGLDGVELVMALEEAFGVDLINDDLSKTVSPRLIGDVIFSKLQATDERLCQSQRAFYILRKALMGLLGLKRQEVTLDCRLSAFIPRERERELWPQLQTVVGARTWPRLARPKWMSPSLAWVAIAIIAATAWLSVSYGCGEALGLICGVVLAALFSVFAAKWTVRYQRCIPARYRCVRDLVPLVINSDRVKWTRDQVSKVVKAIVMEQLGVSEAKYTEDSHFINDFGMD